VRGHVLDAEHRRHSVAALAGGLSVPPPTLCTVSGSQRFASALSAAGSSPCSTALRASLHASRAPARVRAG
jgi:hypothetical protein